MLLARRGLFGGALALLAAPAIIRTPGLLMPVILPLNLVVRRYAVSAFGPHKLEYSDIFKVAGALPDFPAWITPETPHVYCVRDHGFSHGYSWRSETYVRS